MDGAGPLPRGAAVRNHEEAAGPARTAGPEAAQAARPDGTLAHEETGGFLVVETIDSNDTRT